MSLHHISNSLLKTAMDNINTCVCIVDEHSIVKFWNQAATRLYDVTKEEIIGHNITEFFPNALIPKVLKEQKAYEDVYNNPKKGYYIVICAVPLYDEDGQLIGGISIDRDITDYIKTKALLEKTSDNIKLLEEEINTINQRQYAFSNIIGKNKAFEEAMNLCKDVADTNISVLLLGDSGTGKEVVARGIHASSNRKGPFIPLNCSAIPRDLFESELFGYESGAFTGAQRKGKIGKIEAADKGTLFLDEIGELPLEMQPKLLRVLETNTISKLGSNDESPVDIRVIAATNRDLKKQVRDGEFRQDLFYRLNPVVITLPSLKERKEDIELFINHFFEIFCMEYGVNIPAISDDFMSAMINYDWDGNIRELKNVIERVVILHKKQAKTKITSEILPDYITRSIGKNQYQTNCCIAPDLVLKKKVEQLEKETIVQALNFSKGQISKAAKLLQIPRTSIYYKLKKYHISLESTVSF